MRRKAVLLAAEKRAQEVAEREPDISGTEALCALIGTVDVLVDMVIALQSDVERLKRGRK